MPTPDAMTGRIIAAFAAAGLFKRGAVLVGTTAFQLYSPMVGAALSGAALMTRDADVAIARLAVPHMDGVMPMTAILKTIDPTFEPRLHRDHKYPFTFISGRSFVVDVLTTRGRNDGAVLVKGLNCGAQPLKYMEYLIENPVSTVTLIGSGVRVTVPQPARYALHTLIVAQKRAADPLKAPKDVMQARELIAALNASDPDGMSDAIEDAMARGSAWRKLFKDGLKLIA